MLLVRFWRRRYTAVFVVVAAAAVFEHGLRVVAGCSGALSSLMLFMMMIMFITVVVAVRIL